MGARGGATGSNTNNMSNEVNIVADDLFKSRGMNPLTGNEDNLVQESKTTNDINRLLEIMREVGANAVIGYDIQGDQYISINGNPIYNGQPLDVNDIAKNPVSVQSIRDSISNAVANKKSMRSTASKIVTEARNRIASNNYDNATITSVSTQGSGNYIVSIDYDAKRADGSTYRVKDKAIYVRVK